MVRISAGPACGGDVRKADGELAGRVLRCWCWPRGSGGAGAGLAGAGAGGGVRRAAPVPRLPSPRSKNCDPSQHRWK